jgi:hypothetical protein
MALLEQIPNFSQEYLVLFAFGLLLTRLFFNKYRTRLNSIPGPFLAGFTDLWRFFNACFATPHITHLRLHRQTNSHFVRIGPRTVSISDPTLIPTIYGINTGFTKSEYYTLAMLPLDGKFTPSLFTALDEDYHALIKKPIANAYSMSTMVEFEPLVDSTTSLFMSKLDQFADSGTTVDFGVWLQRYAFDVMYVPAFASMRTESHAKQWRDSVQPEVGLPEIRDRCPRNNGRHQRQDLLCWLCRLL